MDPGWTFAINRGGTFTDVVARHSGGRQRVMKLLSDNPRGYVDAALARADRLKDPFSLRAACPAI